MVDTHSDDAREPQCDEADAVQTNRGEDIEEVEQTDTSEQTAQDADVSDGGDREEKTDESDNGSAEDGTEHTDEPSEEGESVQAQEKTVDPQETIAKLGDDLALARADLFNLRKEYTNYVRRSKEAASDHHKRGQAAVLESLIAVLDDIAAAREAGDLQEGPFAAIAEKLENILKTNYQMERYGSKGEEFDPQRHDALMANDSEEVEVATIAQVLQPGYKHGETILRPTKVIVDNPA